MRPAPQGPAAPADALPGSWVDVMPSPLRPWLRLMRLDRPIGIWLLFLPSAFGLVLGAAWQGRIFGTPRDFYLLLLFAAGSVVMRGAGCTFNDIVDRDIDAAVARTRGRPIPSGAVGVKAAWIFLGLECAAGLAVLVQLNWFSILLGAVSLIPIAIYPYMKRITWWPQAWLGLTFNWGALIGFSAQTGRVALPALLLYAACFFWTLGYDTIYALQDKEDDALIGVKSTALLFGNRSRVLVAASFSASMIFATAAIAKCAAVPSWTFVFLLPAAVHLLWQVATVQIESPASCLRVFRSNRDAGLIWAAGLIAATMFAP